MSTVYIAVRGDTVWVRVIGRGLFHNSRPIKQWVMEKISGGCRNVFIDLEECPGMDSTFMGIMTGISMKLKALDRPLINLSNISQHNIRLLETLGLDKFMSVTEKLEIDDSLQWDILPPEYMNKIAITEHMIEAHEQIMQASDEAGGQFKNVHRLLKEDLERQVNKDRPQGGQ